MTNTTDTLQYSPTTVVAVAANSGATTVAVNVGPDFAGEDDAAVFAAAVDLVRAYASEMDQPFDLVLASIAENLELD